MCTREVTRLTPLFQANDEPDAENQLIAVHAYNQEVYIANSFSYARHLLSRLQRLGSHVVLSAYALSGVMWELTRMELGELGGLWRIPPPADEKIRLYAAWLVVTQCCACITWPANFAAGPNRLLLELFQDWILRLSAWNSDSRHAQLDDDTLFRVLRPLRVIHGLTSFLRLVAVQTADMLPHWALEWKPSAMRALEITSVIVDLVALGCQLRVEAVGLRALFALLEWRYRLPRLERLEPYEANEIQRWIPLELALRRSCRVIFRTGDGQLHSSIMSWPTALRAYGVGLKSLRVFHGERAYRRVFPNWAVLDVSVLPAVTLLARGEAPITLGAAFEEI